MRCWASTENLLLPLSWRNILHMWWVEKKPQNVFNRVNDMRINNENQACTWQPYQGAEISVGIQIAFYFVEIVASSQSRFLLNCIIFCVHSRDSVHSVDCLPSDDVTEGRAEGLHPSHRLCAGLGLSCLLLPLRRLPLHGRSLFINRQKLLFPSIKRRPNHQRPCMTSSSMR